MNICIYVYTRTHADILTHTHTPVDCHYSVTLYTLYIIQCILSNIQSPPPPPTPSSCYIYLLPYTASTYLMYC